MTGQTGRPDFLRGGALLGWPALPGVDGGEGAWRAFVATSRPGDRAAALPGLNHALVSTEAARVRLHRWLVEGRPTADPETVAYAGPDDVHALVIDVLRRVASCVAHHAVTRCLVIGIEPTSGGWYQAAPRFPPSEDEPLGLVNIGGAFTGRDLEGIIAHEVSHAWLTPPAPRLDRAAAAKARELRAVFFEAARTLGRVDDLFEVPVRDEVLACLLTASWGFRGPGADARLQAEAARARVRREAGL